MLNIFALRYYYDRWIKVWNFGVRKKTKIHYSYSTQTPLVRFIVNIFPHFTRYLTCSSRWRAELDSVKTHALKMAIQLVFCHFRNSFTLYNFQSWAYPTLFCDVGRCFIAIWENTCSISTPFTRMLAVFSTSRVHAGRFCGAIHGTFSCSSYVLHVASTTMKASISESNTLRCVYFGRMILRLGWN